MNKIIFFLFLLLSEVLNGEYQLLIHKFLFGEISYDMDLINQNNNNDDLNYYGLIENIQNILDIEFINLESINALMKRKKNHLLYILNKEDLHYINFFPNNIFFIVKKDLIEFLEDGYQNYNIFSLNCEKESSFSKLLNLKKKYYVKIGKRIDDILQNFLYILIFLSAFICIIISFIMTKIITNLNGYHQLGISFLICISSYLLFISILINAVYFSFFKNRQFCFIMEYTTILIYSFYKSNLYPILLLILLGWGTIFFGWGQKFRKLNKLIFIVDLLSSILITIAVYFIKSKNKLNLFYIKNYLEYLAILCMSIFSIFKRLIPLSNQTKYEQRINSHLVKIYEFKYNRLFLINLIIFSYTIFFMITPFLECKFINFYANNYNIHYVFQLFYETIFIIFIFVGFLPQKLPENYFDDVVFKYKTQIFLRANIYEEEYFNPSINDDNDMNYSRKLNISILTPEKLREITKKKKFPILLINPFISTNNNKLFKEINFGIVSKST